MKIVKFSNEKRRNSLFDLLGRTVNWFDTHTVAAVVLECVGGVIIAYVLYYHDF